MNEQFEVKKIICHNGMGGCFSHCGLLAYVDRKTKRIVKVEGNPNHPVSRGWICADRAIVPNFPGKWLYHPAQLMHPLKRAGERGEGKWQQLSYNQALGEIAGKLKELKERYGPECLAFIEGTYRTDAFLARARFANAWGNPENVGDPGTICHHPGAAVEQTMTGAYFRALPDVSANSKLIVAMGSNPVESYADVWRALITIRRKIKLIVVDPRFTETARNADVWLQIRPGTDCALFLSWIKILIDEGMYDKEFVEKWTNAPFLIRTDVNKIIRENDITPGGSRENFVIWDEKRNAPAVWKSREFDYQPSDPHPALTGACRVKLTNGKEVECKTVWQQLVERLIRYTPNYVENITWIPSEKIVETARMWWTHRPGGFVRGVSQYQSGKNSSDNHMCMVILLLITGNYDANGGVRLSRSRPGPVIGGKLIIRESMLEGQELIKPDTKKKMLGADRFKVMTWPGFDMHNEHYVRVWGIPQNSAGHSMLTPVPLIWRAILTGKPYPIKAVITWGGNPLMWCPNTQLVYKALKSPNLELHVIQDYWMTPSAELADYVLPGASKCLETPYCCGFEDMCEWLWVGENAIKPLGERRSDYDFFQGLAMGLGLGEIFPWKNVDELIQYRLSPAGLIFKEAVEKTMLFSDTPGYRPYEDKVYAQIDPKTERPRGFATPSGRAEIWGTIIEELGYDPLPSYEEPFESPISTPLLAKDYPLILTTGGRFRPMFHSENRQWGIGFREQHPDPILDIHYNTARGLGINNGDWVWIETRRGRILQRARVGPQQHPSVVNAEASWWYPELPGEDPSLHGAFISNTNILTEDDPDTLDEKTGSWYNRAYLCKVYKATPEELMKIPIIH